ncbi:NAD-glutamate dehydrogenase [Limibaculum sp. M0105]|uniref:NAD-glutamate dehydrogenase n=1 Tax=Thermohalobaculum xanthum TaxID=2753746 RepID=A0A8J7M8X1_9RHOB|nr:NAD-glutamate dehydrogenase [Thermohalobaculum xanthum]MBK0400826.1 NAD-glutamate dehydrogenase [Thermohalobaculum xanthum]
MSLSVNDRIAGRFEEVRAIAAERLESADAKAFTSVLEAFLSTVARDELLEQPAEEIYGATLALWKFCQKRSPGTCKLRIYNPRIAEHGWESSHTIIEALNDDMPFLVDSLTVLITERGLGIHALVHPVIAVKRDAKGNLLDVAKADAKGTTPESIIQVQIDQVADAETLAQLGQEIETMFADVRVAVEDWRTMLDKLIEVSGELRERGPKAPAAANGECCDFLDWLANNHFTFLGYRHFQVVARKSKMELEPGSGLGLMRDPDYTVIRDKEGRSAHWSPQLSDFTQDPSPLLIIKANRRSSVHRPVHFDVVAIKQFDAKGKLVGEHVFIGLFTSAAYNRSPREIPLLRAKVARVIERANLAPSSHDGKALTNVLETYPRDELFQGTEDQLFENAMGVLHLSTRPRTRLFLRSDRFGRFVSCLVYVARERYNTELRVRLGNILSAGLDGRVASWEPSFGAEGLARVHFVIALHAGRVPAYDAAALEAEIVEAVRSWGDILLEELIDHFGEAAGHRLHARYGKGFSASYREDVPVAAAIGDIEKLDTLSEEAPLALSFYRKLEDDERSVRFKIYHRGDPVPLSDALPVLENMGFRIHNEHPYRVELGEIDSWIHDFHMLSAAGVEIDLSRLRAKLEDAFDAAWRGVVDDDRLNRLVLLAGLSARETALLRAYSRFLRQVRIPYSVEYMEDALAQYPAIARLLVDLFAAQFDPSRKLDAAARAAEAEAASAAIEAALEEVPSLDIDQILRRFRNAITSTLRTNYYQPDAAGGTKPYVSFKFDCAALDELPLPRPWREIFVYATWVEGVHLRGGPVARGGLRWSDRKEDYRTEVLGLVKAQQVKNAVIVPVGSKGGFLPRKLPAGGTREEIQAEAIRCYKTFLCGLLDVTDNLVGGALVPPAGVVRRDDDDPYLVVAADKGTATFSDIANGVAGDYGFWLADAFASGGSNGYDHKGMGITAKGAWEAVKRHFRELGHDTQTQPFDVIGVGDMSGDVFGNGMLLSDQIRLIAAFDHRDIFIDPDPDTAASFAERKRLFEAPRTSWKDYDASLISKGGGVFPRSAKSITLTPEIKRVTGLKADKVTPFQLMKAILSARTDLLWFGGIGTYIKSSGESHADAGDRTNDPIRVDAREVGARVIGEGANLGVTQLGRIELDRCGVKVNTDAVDNSAGVDCSDHEVNIKIALGAVVEAGDMTAKQRNTLLAKMTDEVGDLVLEDNYNQTLALSMAEARAATLLDDHARFMRALEQRGQLNREIELLPNDEALAELRARGLGLTRPEIAVLIAYAKIVTFDQLVASSLPDDGYCTRFLIEYMPTPLRQKYREAILGHRLRREIIGTVLANAVVNEAGPSLINRISDETGAGTAMIAKAFVIGRDIFEIEAIRDEINALDNKVAAAAQNTMHLALSDMIASQSQAILARASDRSVDEVIEIYKPGVLQIAGNVASLLRDFSGKRMQERAAAFERDGVPKALATRISGLEFLGGALDIVDVARSRKRDVIEVAETYFAAGARFGLDWLRASARGLETSDHWERVAVSRLVADLRSQQSLIAAAALDAEKKCSGSACIDGWCALHEEAVTRAERLVRELNEGGTLTVAKLAVASSQFRSITG